MRVLLASAALLMAGGAWATTAQLIELSRQIGAEPRMWRNAVATFEGDRYGLGLRVSEGQGTHSWAHSGAGLGSWAWMRGDTEGRAAALLSNRNVALDGTRALLDAKFFGIAHGEVEALPSSRLAGSYAVRGWDEAVVIGSDTGRLRLDAPALGTLGVELRPEGRNRYAAHLPMQAGSQVLIFVETQGEIWLRSPWFVARKIESP